MNKDKGKLQETGQRDIQIERAVRKEKEKEGRVRDIAHCLVNFLSLSDGESCSVAPVLCSMWGQAVSLPYGAR